MIKDKIGIFMDLNGYPFMIILIILLYNYNKI